MLEKIPLEAFRVFDAACRFMNFSRAGRELHITQAAVSRRIQGLEDQLGAKLFTRRGRNLALTPEGERLAQRVRATLEYLEESLEPFRGGGDGTGCLRPRPPAAAGGGDGVAGQSLVVEVVPELVLRTPLVGTLAAATEAGEQAATGRDGGAHGSLAFAKLADGRVLDGAADFISKDNAKDLGASGSAPAPAPDAGAQGAAAPAKP